MAKALAALATLGLTAYLQRRYIDRELDRRFRLYSHGTTGEIASAMQETNEALEAWLLSTNRALTRAFKWGGGCPPVV